MLYFNKPKFLINIYYRLDVIMIELIQGPSEAGVYAGSFRFFEASNMFAYLFAALLLPIFSRMLKVVRRNTSRIKV